MLKSGKHVAPFYILLFGVILLLSHNVKAQEKNLQFDYLNTITGGLSSNRVLSLYRDSKGFLWIGTQAGLNRFNGYDITVFENDSLDPNSLSHNIVNDIFEDSRKRLWVSTLNGLCLYNPLLENFNVYKFVRAHEKEIGSREASAVCEDSAHNIWIALGKHGGISQWDSVGLTFINHSITNNPGDQAFNTVTDLIAGDRNTLWLATMGNGLISFDIFTRKFTFIIDPKIDMGSGTVKRLFMDNHKNLWVMTEGKGLFKYETNQNKITAIPVKDDGSGTNGDFIRAMAQYDDNHLFIGVDQGGINSLNLQTGRFDYIKYNELHPRSLGNNGVWSMIKDKEEILWVGTSAAGISYYNPKKERFHLHKHYPDPNSLSYNAILCFFEDKKGKIWIGTDGGGLNIYDPSKKSFSVFKHDPKNPVSIGSNVILTIDEDQLNNIWLGTWADGLIRYNRNTGKFYQYLTSEHNPATIGSNNIWSLKTDKQNNLWISNYDYGIDLYRDGVFQRKFRYDPVKLNPDSFFNINVLFRGKHQKIWIARGRNISFIDTISNTIRNHITLTEHSVSIFSMYEDDKENLWLGTNTQGVYCFNKAGQLLSKLDMSNGLPSNTVFAILEDDNDNFWMTTNAGICKYNKTQKTFKNYPQNDPLQGNNYKEWAYLKSKSGTLYFGGYNGFNAFNPADIEDNTYEPYVYFNDFQIFGKTVSIGEYDNILRQSIGETKKIVIPYNLSVFSLSFTAVSFTFPENIQYKYMLEGFENDWTTRPANRRYVTYTNLNAGRYILRVKATNNDGIWSKHEASIEIIILPPWWKTWWFRGFSLLFLLILFAYIYRRSLSRFKRKNQMLEKMVRERTKEISDRNQEIESQKVMLEQQNRLLVEQRYEMEAQNEELQSQAEAMQTQSEALQNQTLELTKYQTQLEKLVEERTKELMVAKEKAEESDRLKSSFLANLSHEIRTPLNAIIGFTNLLVENDITPEEKESFTAIIQRSSDMLLSLINDVIDFSKIEAGQLVVDITEVPLRNIYGHVKEIFHLEAKKQEADIDDSLGFKINVNEELLDLILLTDETRLLQIIGNLISNAIKFTPKGSIEFGCSPLDQKGFVELYVKGTGIGIKKENHHAIFQRFRKIEEDKNKLYRGAGLGLAISSELVQLLNGNLRVESAPGKGSIFTVVIPGKTNPKIMGAGSESPQRIVDYPNFTGFSILVAEDDFSNYKLLEKILKKTGADVHHATNGHQVVTMVNQPNNFDVILMDLKMPELDGLQALQLIRQNNIQIPVVAQTAYALAGEVHGMKKAGFDFYLAKPVRVNELFACLNALLNNATNKTAS